VKKVVRLLKEFSPDGTVESVVIEPRCDRCGGPTARIEITPPHKWPKDCDAWGIERRDSYEEHRDFTEFYLLYAGAGGSNGWVGDAIDESRAVTILEAFAKPPVPSKIQGEFHDGAGLCQPCEKFYCETHWNVSVGGYGRCPQGHGKSLDPHWSPDSYD
jgi:hypothetical protein